MQKPRRIKLSTVAGWRMPPNTRKVADPTRWRNPFRVMGRNEYLFCDASHRRTIFTPWVIFDHDQDIWRNPATPAMAMEFYRRWLKGEFDKAGIVRPCLLTSADLMELRGFNLACYCDVGRPCHADVLLELANK